MRRSLAALLIALGLGLVLLMGRKALAYSNGKPIGYVDLVPVEGRDEKTGAPKTVWVEATTASAFARMRAAAAAAGVVLWLSSAFRTMEKQTELWDGWMKKIAGFFKAAAPGYSNHQDGRAIDIIVGGVETSREFKWLAAHAHEFGFSNAEGKAAGEPWHWVRVFSAPNQPAGVA